MSILAPSQQQSFVANHRVDRLNRRPTGQAQFSRTRLVASPLKSITPAVRRNANPQCNGVEPRQQ
jgi:hypothetical protein